MKLAVRQLIDALRDTGNTDVFFHEVVVRLQILVTQRPVFSEAILGRSFKIEIAEAKADAPPDVRAATGDAHAAQPTEGPVRWCGVRLFQVVAEPTVVVFRAGITKLLNHPSLPHHFWGPVPVPELEVEHVFSEIIIGLGATG